jgi:hypothetical protein
MIVVAVRVGRPAPLKTVFWAQCGQVTIMPTASEGNSICPPQCWQAHLRYFVSLIQAASNAPAKSGQWLSAPMIWKPRMQKRVL